MLEIKRSPTINKMIVMGNKVIIVTLLTKVTYKSRHNRNKNFSKENYLYVINSVGDELSLHLVISYSNIN